MALAFLALNEAGLAHGRAGVVCRALESVGERPVIFSQGHVPPDDRSRFPGKHLPSLGNAHERVRRQAAWDIQSLVGLSSPAVLVEDTHPNPIRLPSSVRRVLLVPPAAFDELQQLNHEYGDVYSAFLLCDAPDLPTWPYPESETAAVLAWDRWHVIGPIGCGAGDPDASRLQHLILGVQPQHSTITVGGGTSAHGDSGMRSRRRFFRDTVPLVIRVDDVVALDAPLRWLLEVLAARRLRASLEVVPYLATVTEQSFDTIDPSATLFEVAQHGYAHIPYTVDGRRYEFVPARQTTVDPPAEDEAIAWGKGRLEAMFPARFRGGFSAPFDGLPDWLPAVWAHVGGAFISCLSPPPRHSAPLPLVRAGVDVWRWRRNRGFDPRDVVRQMRAQLRDDGHAGLVLHAHRYVRHVERQRLCRLLDVLHAEGFRSVPLHQRAMGPAPETRIDRLLRRALRRMLNR